MPVFYFFAIVMAKNMHELLKYGIEVNTLSLPLMEFLTDKTFFFLFFLPLTTVSVFTAVQ